MSTTKEKIINTISISEIYPKLLNGNRGECAMHENTSSPSFRYHPDTKSWNCFSCGTGGSVIDLCKHMNNISYREAVMELANEHKIPINEEDKKTIKAREIIENVLSTFTDLCHENLMNSEYYEDLKDRRGFSEDIITEYKIGLFDNTIKPKLKKMFNNTQLVYAGLLSKK